jgi:hypothetical protein
MKTEQTQPGTARHTAGPWVVTSENAGLGFNVYADKKTRIGHTVGFEPRPGSNERKLSTEEAEANARLIAAAPELLEALKDMVAMEEWDEVPIDSPCTVGKAKRAIAKAGGAK